MDAHSLVDPQYTCLWIGGGGIVPSDQDEWRALGECIESHQHLETLVFDQVNTTHENLEALLTGVNQNRTVRELRFYGCRGEWPLGILEIFFRDNQNLSLFEVHRCFGGFMSSLSAALRSCTPRFLQHITCEGSRMGEEDVAEFIEALAGLPQLKKLDFGSRHIGLRGCGVVAALFQSPACVLQTIRLCNYGIGNEGLAVLQPAVAASSTLTELLLERMHFSTAALQSFAGVLRRPTCMLKNLDLSGTIIGDDEMISFADALATNRTLEELRFYSEHAVSDIGFTAMTRALCNTSSIGDVHSSNHTLQYLNLREMPDDLRNYLRMNDNENKSLVAREKILMHLFKGDFSMEPFHENAMAQNILPHLLSWIGRTHNGESFTALFNFLRRMPPVWGDRHPVCRRSRRKRKVRN